MLIYSSFYLFKRVLDLIINLFQFNHLFSRALYKRQLGKINISCGFYGCCMEYVSRVSCILYIYFKLNIVASKYLDITKDYITSYTLSLILR